MDLLATLRDRLRTARPRDLAPHQSKRAAVLVPVFDSGGVPYLLLTKRTETVEHHKGQISFPGGGEEPGDRDLLDTALRETYEEIGLPPEVVEVWGRLDETETVVSGFAITPYVGFIPPPARLRPNPNEIQEIVSVPLEVFLNPANLRVERVAPDGREMELLFYDYPPHVIWGATARIIKSMVRLLADEAERAFRSQAQGGGDR
ncbi:MAG: CoA pyrophosphatase [Armatimonadetes bacterium]|nr:CoA pyrophosphatase [Armatimonadota bacterium]